MHVRKLVFAQVMAHLPWKRFGRNVDRYGGDATARCLFVVVTYRDTAGARGIFGLQKLTPTPFYLLAACARFLDDPGEFRDFGLYESAKLLR